MIPKIIHFVWVGPKEISDFNKNECMSSWEKLNPGFEFKFWNENNIDKNIPYINSALKNKKWANVSNLVRLQMVYKYGGVYLDTDVKVLKPFKILLDNNCFFGFQLKFHETHWVNNAIFGAKKNHWLIGELINSLLSQFDGNESADLSSPVLVTTILKKYGLTKYMDKPQKIKDVTLYPVEYFYPFTWEDKNLKKYIKPNTITIHFWEKRWE